MGKKRGSFIFFAFIFLFILIAFFIPNVRASLEGPKSGLVGWWKFNEGNGTVAYDSSGNGYNGRLYDGATWVNRGKQSKGVAFDGNLDTVQDMGIAPFEYRGGDMSASLWFYADSTETDGGDILSKVWTRGGDYNYKIYRSKDNQVALKLMGDSATSFVTSNKLKLDDWNHIAFSLSSAKSVKLYLNDILEVDSFYAASDWTPVKNENQSLTLGCVYPSITNWSSVNLYCVKGKIDNVRVYNKTLSFEEVASLYYIDGVADDQGIAFISSSIQEGSIISGQITLSAETAGVVQSVQFTIDGLPVGSSLTSPPYQISWDSSSIPNGVHILGVTSVTSTGASVSALPRRIFVSNGDGLAIQAINPISSDKILPDMTALPGTPANTLSLSAARGEFEPVSFVLRSQNKNLENVILNASDLQNGASKITSDMIDIKYVKVWYQAGPTAGKSTAFPDNPYPDPTPELLLNNDELIRMNTNDLSNEVKFPDGTYKKISSLSNSSKGYYNSTEFPIKDSDVLQTMAILPANQTKQFWITVHVPENATPGMYTGQINIFSNGNLLKTLTLKLNVHNFSWLETPKMQSMYNYGYIGSYFPDGVQVGCNGKNESQYRAEMKDLRDHGVKAPAFAQTSYRPSLEREFQIRKELGMNGVPVYGYTGPNLDTLPTYSDLQTRLNNLKNFSRIYGFTEVYAYAIDEANAVGGEPLMISEFQHFKNVHDLGGKNYVAGYAPQYASYITNVTFDGRTQTTYKWLLEFLDTTIDSGRKNSTYASDWHQVGHKIFNYGDPQIGVENPQIYRRNFGVVIWAADYDGTMDWVYQNCAGKPWDDFDSPKGTWRDSTFAYPTLEKPIDTIEWEGYREAIDDLRYIATLEAAIAAGRGSGDVNKQTAANQAQNYLDNLRSSVLAQIGTGTGTADFSINLYAMRESIVNHIYSIALLNLTSYANDSNYILTLTKTGNGLGVVSGGLIDCGSTCSALVSFGSAITLVATPNAGSTFAGWSGACSGTNSTCTVLVNSATNVIAMFNINSTSQLSSGNSGSSSQDSQPLENNITNNSQTQYGQNANKDKSTSLLDSAKDLIAWSHKDEENMTTKQKIENSNIRLSKQFGILIICIISILVILALYMLHRHKKMNDFNPATLGI